MEKMYNFLEIIGNFILSFVIIIAVGLYLDYLSNGWFHDSIFAIVLFPLGFAILFYGVFPKLNEGVEKQ